MHATVPPSGNKASFAFQDHLKQWYPVLISYVWVGYTYPSFVLIRLSRIRHKQTFNDWYLKTLISGEFTWAYNGASYIHKAAIDF